MRTLGLLLLLIVVIIGLSNVAVLVNKTNGIPDVFQRLWPEQFVNKEDQQAIDTQMAPFAEAENAAKPVELDPAIQYDPLGKEVSVKESLDVQHRHEAAVSKWVMDNISEVLNFSIASYDEHKRTTMAELMNPNAIKEFEAFLNSTNMLSHMKQNNYELKGFVADVPEMRASGAVNKRFRWVYDIPVNLTFLPAGAHDYKELKSGEYQSEDLRFRVQIGRVAEGGRDGIIIETWEVLPGGKAE